MHRRCLVAGSATAPALAPSLVPVGRAFKCAECGCARQTQRQRQRLRVLCSSAKDSFGDDIRRIAKRIQGGLPIVGLLSRLAAPTGGFDEVVYPEFCRALIDRADASAQQALQDLAVYGKEANSRWIFLMLWMARHGPGLVQPKDVLSAARRIRVTQDIEIEIDRFEGSRQEALKKYSFMQRPEPPLAEQLSLAVDALALLCCGVEPGQPAPPAFRPPLQRLLALAFTEVDSAAVEAALDARTWQAA